MGGYYGLGHTGEVRFVVFILLATIHAENFWPWRMQSYEGRKANRVRCFKMWWHSPEFP